MAIPHLLKVMSRYTLVRHGLLLNRLMNIWESDLLDKIEWKFFQAAGIPVLLHGCTIWTREKARWELHKNATCRFQNILETAVYKTAAVWPLTSHLINQPRPA